MKRSNYLFLLICSMIKNIKYEKLSHAEFISASHNSIFQFDLKILNRVQDDLWGVNKV
jgi:hypothetical protein